MVWIAKWWLINCFDFILFFAMMKFCLNYVWTYETCLWLVGAFFWANSSFYICKSFAGNCTLCVWVLVASRDFGGFLSWWSKLMELEMNFKSNNNTDTQELISLLFERLGLQIMNCQWNEFHITNWVQTA